MHRIGFHISLKDGLRNVPQKANQLGCNTIQIFSRNPRSWYGVELDESEVKIFHEKMKEYDIDPCVIHMPYLPNLASEDKNLYKRSIVSLKTECKRANQLKVGFVNIHIGRKYGDDIEAGFKRVINALNKVISSDTSEVVILLENTAGQGTEIGYVFDHIKYIIDRVENKNRVGVCLDTAHLFEAGYDLRDKNKVYNTFKEFDSIVGLTYLKVIHYNDSLTDFNSRVDRHANIGEGNIGNKGMKAIINCELIRDIPLIMETPKKQSGDDINNMKRVREYLKQ